MPVSTTVMPRAFARGDDLGEVALHVGDRQTAKTVVGAELDDQNPHVALERPVETAEAAGRRVARHAGVDDLVVDTLSVRSRAWISDGTDSSFAARSPRSGCRQETRCAVARTRGRPSTARPGACRRSYGPRLARPAARTTRTQHVTSTMDRSTDRIMKPCFHYVIRRGHGVAGPDVSRDDLHHRSRPVARRGRARACDVSISSDSPMRSGADGSTSGRTTPPIQTTDRQSPRLARCARTS